MKKIKIERSKSGIPCIWEKGGGYTNTGEAAIVAGKNGLPKEAIYIRQRGELANAEHALIPVEVGDYIIKADHHREDFKIGICRILNFEENRYTTYGLALPEQAVMTERQLKEIYGAAFNELDGPIVSQFGPPIKKFKLEGKNVYICKTSHRTYAVYEEIEKVEHYAIVEQVNCFSWGEWDVELPAHLEAAVQAAMEKATCYHCRSPHYIDIAD